jgi:putative resolvase
MSNMETETTYRLPRAAAILSVHPRTLKRWGRDGHIRLIELPGGQFRVPCTEITRLLAASSQPEPETAPTPEA